MYFIFKCTTVKITFIMDILADLLCFFEWLPVELKDIRGDDSSCWTTPLIDKAAERKQRPLIGTSTSGASSSSCLKCKKKKKTATNVWQPLKNIKLIKKPFTCFVASLSKEWRAVNINSVIVIQPQCCCWLLPDAAAWATPWTHFTSPCVCPLCPLHTHPHQWSTPASRPHASTAPPVWKTQWDSPASVQTTGLEAPVLRVTLLQTHQLMQHTPTNTHCYCGDFSSAKPNK